MNPLNHVAIIMDGNGRWGLKYRNSRNVGHKEGLKTVETIIKSSIKNKIKFINTPKNIREQYQYFTMANIKKLRKTGYKKKFFSLEDGIRDYIRNHLIVE